MRRFSSIIRALKGRLGHGARPEGRDEPFRARVFAEPALQRTDATLMVRSFSWRMNMTTLTPPTTQPRRGNKGLGITLATILVLTIALLGLVWQLGFFEFSGTDPSSKVVGAALALVGVVLTAAVSAVGLVIRHSIDQQSQRREESEAQRLAALQLDAERRLKLEAATRVVQLFSTSSGTPSPAIQREGALFTLASLGQHELTLDLTNELLSKGELNPDVAETLLDRALTEGDTAAQNKAIGVIRRNAARLVTKDSVCLTNALSDWHPGLSEYVRDWAPIAFAEVLLSRPITEWTGGRSGQAAAIIAALAIGWEEEKVPRIKNDLGVVLHALLQALPFAMTLFHPRRTVDTAKLDEELRTLKSEAFVLTGLLERIDAWASKDEATDLFR